jgi:EamA domain-containing membrane protein RarD
MLFWWTYRQPQWLRVAAGLFLFLTLLATLGLGEHYLVDLVVAVPFALASFAVFTGFLPGNRVSWVALGVGLGLSIFWFVLFRSPMRITASQPQIAWPLSVSTVVLSLLVVPWRRIPSPTSGRTTNS